MPESALHARLVRMLVDFAENEFGNLNNIALYIDSFGVGRDGSPQRIGGYVPDVLARDIPSTKTMVGEAKTQRDLETEHSREQIRAFVEYLVHTPNGIFVLCVPAVATATAYSLLKTVREFLPPTETRTVVLNSTGVTIG